MWASSFFVHYMKSSLEELLRDLQIISKELFFFSWNLVSTTNLNTAFWNGCVIENGWCLFPWSSKGITNKMPQPWTPPRGKLEKRPYVHRAVEMKQPPTYNSAFFNRWRILCLKHILTLFLGVQERKHQSFPMMLPCWKAVFKFTVADFFNENHE